VGKERGGSRLVRGWESGIEKGMEQISKRLGKWDRKEEGAGK